MDSHDPQVGKIFLWCVSAGVKGKDIDIIIWRYVYRKTLKETGELIRPKVSRERIRQREYKALELIRKYIKRHDNKPCALNLRSYQ